MGQTLNTIDQKHFHFIGIGGIGMGGLASLVMDRGNKVTGSDVKENSLVKQLKEKGASISIEHTGEHIAGADYVVFSSAIRADNPEFVFAQKNNIPLIKRAQLLAELMRGYEQITVAGAHGKTTTSSMIAFMLHQAGLEPTAAVGGIVHAFSSNIAIGKGEYFVAETDESDGSFLFFTPKYSVITNIDFEHIDFYKHWERILETYRTFIDQTDPDGTIIACGDDKHLSYLLKTCPCPVMTYGFSPVNDFVAENIEFDHLSSSFDCRWKDKQLGRISLNIPGKHNIANSLACLAVGLKLGLEFDVITAGLRNYQGVQRRFQQKGEVNNILIFDDYAHHPTEIRATLSSAKAIDRNRLVVAMQPHRYSRLSALMNDFVESLLEADYLVITDVYEASEEPIEGVNAQKLVESIREKTSKPVIYVPKDDVCAHVSSVAQKGDLIITLGAGDITQISEQIVGSLKAKYAKTDQVKTRRIGVLMGGYSSERSISLKSGTAVLNALKEEGLDAAAIDIVDRDEKVILKQILDAQIDVAFITLHGALGEDGRIQSILDQARIPYTGSSAQANRLCIDKAQTQECLKKNNINIAPYMTLCKNTYKIIQSEKDFALTFPVVVKPALEGSSIGITIVKDFDKLNEAIEAAWGYGDKIVIEQYIAGREMTVGILDDKPLSVIEICPKTAFFDFTAKYQKGMTEYVVPAPISKELTRSLQQTAFKTHQVLGCSHFSRVDFMLDRDGQYYILELNTIPGFTETSLLPKAAQQQGINFNQLCLRLVDLAYGKKKEVQDSTAHRAT